MSKRWLALSIVALVFVFTSIPTALADGPIAGQAGRAEVRFLEGMSDHHQMALDMANDCLKKAKTDTVVKMCQNIITAQTAEIKTMQDWLKAWYKVDYKTAPMMNGASGGMQMSGDSAGMMGMMAGLSALQGRDYETAFLESMIDHHDDAIHMSQRILKIAQHKELRDMAQKIIGDQGGEIRDMQALLVQYGDK